jgi:hypothetical protein
MWKQGAILVPNPDESHTTVRYWAKVYETGSQFGIEGGRISKLMLKADNEIIYNYDRGLDIPPQSETAEKALAILLHEYN